MSKIKTAKEIQEIVTACKMEGKRVVTYNGSFDILHLGHILSIQEAKKQGDILIIPLNSDTSIKQYKSSKRPIVSENDRLQMLAALQDVDFVVLFDEINCKKILDLIKPDIHCNGSDWGKNCVERETVEKNGGEIHVLSWHKGHSTSDLINKILHAYKTPLIKAVFLDRDGTINDNRSGYIHTIEEFELLPGVEKALQELSETDYKIIIITNQSGIGRQLYTHDEYQKLNKWMMEMFDKKGIRIDKVYHCPHTPEALCDCRKPNTGMLLQAVKDFDISLNDSWLVGDDKKDIIAGRNANIKTIKLGESMDKKLKLEPNYYAKDLLDAVSYILK